MTHVVVVLTIVENSDLCGACCYYTWAGTNSGGGIEVLGGGGCGILLQAFGNTVVTGSISANGGNGGNAGRPLAIIRWFL